MIYKESALYERGQKYKQFGEMLMDENTTIVELSAFAFENGFELQLQVKPATKPQEEHFTCEHCQLRYKRTGFHDHVGDTDEEIVPLCDSCYALFLEEAKKQGYKINDIGGLEEQ
jgi:hypothetical protein